MLTRNLILSFLLCPFLIHAQDAYHQGLDSRLQSDYSLPAASWVIGNTEQGIYNDVISYGCSEQTVTISEQDFSLASQVGVAQAGNNPWDSGWNIRNNSRVNQGDKVLVLFYLRSLSGSAKVNVFAERSSDFFKEFYLSTEVEEDWTPFLIRFESTDTYNANELVFGYHLALQQQDLQIGGFTVINYAKQVQLEDLPTQLNNERYGGYEVDAEWRTTAAANINSLRKANLQIQFTNSAGDPISNVPITIEMQQHLFDFGTAITANRLAGNNQNDPVYQEKLGNLDGKGHGFSSLVFENDLKWDGWEEQWFVNNQSVINAVNWVHQQGFRFRGHNLVWPGFQYLPEDIQPNRNNPTYVWNRIQGRLRDMLETPGLGADRVQEWDVLNEIVANTDLEPTFQQVDGNVTGREFYADIFKEAKTRSPDTKLYLNDYVTISQNNTSGVQYNILHSRVQELLEAGAPIDGIGFQGHVGTNPIGIPDVLFVLDDFYDRYGLLAKITEFDMPPDVSETLAANYLGDILTACFGHESMDGFIFWNFWDGHYWLNPGAHLFAEDWSVTPAGERYFELVFEEWWTDTTAMTSNEGLASIDGFKGKYEVFYGCGAETIRQSFTLDKDTTLNLICDAQVTAVRPGQEQPSLAFQLVPNPGNGPIFVELEKEEPAELRLFDLAGRLIHRQSIQTKRTLIDVDLKGTVYWVEILQDRQRGIEKLIIVR